jgi:predicted transcriptional regulator of viral defense system
MPTFPETYSGAHGLQLMEALDAAGELVFTTGDVLAAGRARSLTQVQVNNVLKRLVAAGWVRRIKRGLFAVTGKLPGSVAAHDFAIATAIHVPSALSHATALNLHGLSEQVPRIITCTTTAKIVTPAMRQRESDARRRASEWNIEGLRIRFVSVVPSRFFGIEDVWVDTRTRVPVTDRERTVLDLFVDPRGRSGIREALGVLEEHVSRLDVPKLVSYAVRLDVASVGKRLGWALESRGIGSDVLAPLLALHLGDAPLLDPQGPRRGPLIARWQLRDNLPGATQ